MNDILNLLNKWDPIGLLPYAPYDEYIIEAQKIDDYISQNSLISVDELANLINDIFCNTFGNDVYTEDFNACYSIAKSLLHGKRSN